MTSAAFPLLCADELFGDHIVGLTTEIGEYVLWRDAAGQINVWEDRCCHRGVRLSIGTIVEDEVKCRYHGWRFASGGACSLIPAHPHQRPPAAAHATVYPCSERYGLVWLQTSDQSAATMPALNGESFSSLRSITVLASEEMLRREIKSQFSVSDEADHWLIGSRLFEGHRVPLLFAILPQSRSKATIHSVLRKPYSPKDWQLIARAHNDDLKALRGRLERRSASASTER